MSSAIKTITEFPNCFKNAPSPYDHLYFSGKKLGEDSTAKVIILGDLSVGKTCIVSRFCHQEFNQNYKATIGIDFQIETFHIRDNKFTLQIWDTAGQERFKCIAQSYYRGAHAIVIVFDLSHISTLLNCTTWLQDALLANQNTAPLLFLVGNKTDLLSSAAYENMEQCAGEFATKFCAEYWAVSAKTGENIDRFFMRVAALTFESEAEKCYKNIKNVIPVTIISLNLNQVGKRNNKKKKCNCS